MQLGNLTGWRGPGCSDAQKACGSNPVRGTWIFFDFPDQKSNGLNTVTVATADLAMGP